MQTSMPAAPDSGGVAKIETILKWIDLVNDWAGKISAFAVVPLTLIAAFEVVMRYLFNRPTIWAWDVNIQLGAILVIMGGGYTLLKKGHVNVDIIYTRFTRKQKALIDIVTIWLFFFAFAVLVWKAGGEALYSFRIKEAYSSVWQPPIYPLKMLVPVGAFLFLLQGVAKFLRDLMVLTGQGRKESDLT